MEVPRKWVRGEVNLRRRAMKVKPAYGGAGEESKQPITIVESNF